MIIRKIGDDWPLVLYLGFDDNYTVKWSYRSLADCMCSLTRLEEEIIPKEYLGLPQMERSLKTSYLNIMFERIIYVSFWNSRKRQTWL